MSVVDISLPRFLLASLHMDAIVNKTNRKAIRDTLKHLPKSLDDTYAEVINRIKAQQQEDRELAEKVLSWVCFACRPLTVVELQHAVAVEEGDTDLELDALTDEETLLSVCAGIVAIDTESNIVRLVRM